MDINFLQVLILGFISSLPSKLDAMHIYRVLKHTTPSPQSLAASGLQSDSLIESLVDGTNSNKYSPSSKSYSDALLNAVRGSIKDDIAMSQPASDDSISVQTLRDLLIPKLKQSSRTLLKKSSSTYKLWMQNLPQDQPRPYTILPNGF